MRPRVKTARPSIHAHANPYSLVNFIILSGINSNIDKDIITLNEKLKAKLIKLSLSLNFIKTINPPITVLNPAKEEIF